MIQATIRPGTPSPKAMMEPESRLAPLGLVGVGLCVTMSGFTPPLVVRVALGDEVPLEGVGALPEV